MLRCIRRRANVSTHTALLHTPLQVPVLMSSARVCMRLPRRSRPAAQRGNAPPQAAAARETPILGRLV